MYKYLSAEDMKAAAELFATPVGRRIRFGLAEAEKAGGAYLDAKSGVDPESVSKAVVIDLKGETLDDYKHFLADDIVRGCATGIETSAIRKLRDRARAQGRDDFTEADARRALLSGPWKQVGQPRVNALCRCWFQAPLAKLQDARTTREAQDVAAHLTPDMQGELAASPERIKACTGLLNP